MCLGYRALTLFSSFRDIPNYESSDPFRGHAIHVFFTIEKAIQMLGNLEELVPLLERMGKRHVGTTVRHARWPHAVWSHVFGKSSD